MSTTLLRYPIAAVARMTGLSLDTIRAWERRHGTVAPERGPRGRLYTDAQVQRLRLLAAVIGQGHTIGQVASLPRPALEALLHRTAATPHREQTPPVGHAIAPAIAAVEAFDYPALDREIGRLAALYVPRDFVYEVVLPLMRVTGERWHEGRLSISQEHMVSAVVHGVMGTMVRLHVAPAAASRLLFSCPSGEQHEFGLLAAAMLAAAAGLGVVYLGPNLPADGIAGAAREADVLAAVVAVTGGSTNARDEVSRIREALAPHVELWVGGPDPVGFPGRAGSRNRLVAIGSFEEFERHLRRLGGR